MVNPDSLVGTELGSGVGERRLSMVLVLGMNAERRLLALCRSSELLPDRGLEEERGREMEGAVDGLIEFVRVEREAEDD